MFKPNPLSDSIHAYLRETVPHSRWSYILLAIALVTAVPPFIRPFDSRDGMLVQVMAAVILAVYWLIQFSVIRSAVKVTRYDWQTDAPDTLIGTLSRRDVIVARIRAILRHHRLHLILITLALLGLCLAVMGYLYYGFRGMYWFDILKHVTGVRLGSPAPAHPPYPIVPSLLFITIAAGMLYLQTLTNTLFSVSFGLMAGAVRRAFFFRIVSFVVIVSLFLGLFLVIDVTAMSCNSRYPRYTFDYVCPDNLARHRILTSIQGAILSFIDGGVSNAASTIRPGGTPLEEYVNSWGEQSWRPIPTYFGTHLDLQPYQIRHLVVAGVTVLAQLALAGLLLRRGGFSKRKQWGAG